METFPYLIRAVVEKSSWPGIRSIPFFLSLKSRALINSLQASGSAGTRQIYLTRDPSPAAPPPAASAFFFRSSAYFPTALPATRLSREFIISRISPLLIFRSTAKYSETRINAGTVYGSPLSEIMRYSCRDYLVAVNPVKGIYLTVL